MSIHVSVCRYTQLQQRVLVADVFKISVVHTQLSLVQKLNDTYSNIVNSGQRHKYNDNDRLGQLLLTQRTQVNQYQNHLP